MKSKTLVLLCMLMSLHGAEAQKTFLKSTWKDSIVTIDGNPADWQQPFNYSDSKIKSQMSIKNDGAFLYICLRSSDHETQMKIIRGGMTLAFDTKGGKKQGAAVGFPIPSSYTIEMPEPGSDEQPKRPDIQKIKMEMLTAMKELHVQKLLNIPDGNLPLDNPLDIRAAVNWDKSDVLTYELKIPFSVFFKESITTQDTVKPMSLFITINGMNLPAPPGGMDGPADGGGQGGPPGGGGMGGPGGGPPGGGGMGGPPGGVDGNGPPGMGRMMEMAKSQETILRFTLSYK